MSVRELIRLLERFDAEMPVIATYDCRCAEGEVVAVEIDRDHPEPMVTLIVE